MIQEAISLAVTGQNLDEEQMTATMQEIMSGKATDAQIGSFITALRMKGETIDEIAGAVRVMREKATFVDTGVDTASGELLMDIGAQAATVPAPLMSPPPRPLLWPGPESRWPSTVIGPYLLPAAVPMCWRPWVWIFPYRRIGWRNAYALSG
jgi:hypothetical protein